MKTKMLLFWICCVCLLLFLPDSDSILFPHNRCSRNDCSFQLQDFRNDTCKIYNNSVCLDFYELTETSKWMLASEEESKFNVSVAPYTAEIAMYHANVTRSAINISLSINNADIDELVIKIYTENNSTAPICLLFDFRNITEFPINLYYDCLFNLSERGMQNVFMDFIALPVKEKLNYYVFIPGTQYNGSCEWQPLIMLFRGSLHNGLVQVKFSQASELYNVSFYEIKLTEHLSGTEKIADITPDISRTMLFAQFTSVDGGLYSVSIKPVISEVLHNCFTETDRFYVERTTSDYMLTVYLCIFILLIFSAFVFLKMFRHNIVKLKFRSKRRILLIYSHDCKEHKEFVMAFMQYLIQHCYGEVSSIYDELPTDWNPDEKLAHNISNVKECNPQEWIKKKYNECDVIMFLISEGLFHTLDTKQSLPIQKFHEWQNQLVWVSNFISLEIGNKSMDIRKKKLCKVCFPYSKEEHIPDTLKPGYGDCYLLPKDLNNLINYMHDSSECSLYSKLCVANFEPPFKGTELCKKMEAVQAAVDSNKHICIVKDTKEVENRDESSSTSYSSEESSSISNFSDESSNSWIDSLFKSNSKERFTNLLSGLSNICPMRKNENIELTMEESDGDSDSEKSNVLFYHCSYSESEDKCVIENILNENWT